MGRKRDGYCIRDGVCIRVQQVPFAIVRQSREHRSGSAFYQRLKEWTVDCTFLPPLAIALSGEALEWLTVFGYVGLAAIACWGVLFSPIDRQ